MGPLARTEKPSDSIIGGSVGNGDSYYHYYAYLQTRWLAFTMFPNVQGKTDKRALGQANRYMNANIRRQREQDNRETPAAKSGQSSAAGEDCDPKASIAEPVDENGQMAESTALTLLNISKGAIPSVSSEQPTEICLPEFEGMDMERLSMVKPVGPIRKATPTCGYHCTEQSCEYFSKGFTYKARRDCHVVSHYNRIIICEFCSVNKPLVMRSFESVVALKAHIIRSHIGERDFVPIACTTCNRHNLTPEGFLYHIDYCVLRWMEDRATEDPMKYSINYGVESSLVS